MTGGIATTLLGATVELNGGQTGEVVSVYPSAQGFGTCLTVKLPDGTLTTAHDSTLKKVLPPPDFGRPKSDVGAPVKTTGEIVREAVAEGKAKGKGKADGE